MGSAGNCGRCGRSSAPLIAGLLAALVASSAQATVSPHEERVARDLFEQGVALVNQGDLPGAIDKFRESYDHNPRSIVLFNIGTLQQQLGDLPGALDTFRRYLDEAGEEIDADRRQQVEQTIHELAAQLTFLEITVSEAGASVLVNGHAVGTSPLPASLPIAAGMIEVRVRKSGFDEAVMMVPAPEGETTRVNVALVPSVAAPTGTAGGGDTGEPVGPTDGGDMATPWWQEWWFWTAVGAVVVGASLGAGLGAWAAEGGGSGPAVTWSVWGR